MVPEGWKEGCVGDLLEGLESGVSVNGEDREVREHEKAVLKVSSVSYGTFDAKAAKVINPTEIERARINPKKDRVIISRSNTEAFVGASAYVDEDYPNLFLPDKLWQTIPKPKMNMKWLAYLLSSSYVRYSLKKLATGTSGSMKNITKSELLTLKVLIPSLVEQKKIAQILSTWDKAITTTEQLLANSQQQKKALMQQLLTGKKRLLDENGVRFSGEWKNYTLEDLEGMSWVELGRGNVISKKDIDTTPGDYPIYSSSVKNNGLMGNYGKYMFDEELISWSVDGGGNFFYRPKHKFSVTNVSGYMRIKTEKLNYQFVAAQLELHHSKLEFDYQSKAHPSVIRKVYTLAIPTAEEQQKIAAVLSTADQKIKALQKKIDSLKQEKNALMQQLLTGKRRVKVDEEAA